MNKVKVIFGLLSALSCSATFAAAATTLNVPVPYSTIQAAINVAATNDTVKVQPGTYFENIDFLGKSITVTSVDPSNPSVVSATIIDGGGMDVVVKMFYGDMKLRGFTIRNGRSYMNGGGVALMSDSPTTEVADCVITGNRSDQDGGGLWVRGVWSTFLSYAPKINRCVIAGNTAVGGGGGVSIMDSAPVLTNCTIQGNSAVAGGGIYFTSAAPKIYNCTIAKNTASVRSGGIDYSYPQNVSELTNSIVQLNSPDQINPAPGPFNMTYNDLSITGVFLDPIYHNFDADPLFKNVSGTDPLSWDLSLQPGSPCINTGMTLAAVSGDIKRILRPQGGAYDIGAFETFTASSAIAITKALMSYTADTLEINATSTRGSSAALSVVNFGPLTWNASSRIWKATFTGVARAPQSITVCGPTDGCRSVE